MSQNELKSLLIKKKENYDLHRQYFKMLTEKKEQLKDGKKQLVETQKVKLGELERNSIEIKYSKHMIHMKCIVKKAILRNRDRKTQQLHQAFVAFKLNSLEGAMKQNLTIQKTQQKLQLVVKTDIQNKMREFLNRRLSHAFKKWSTHCTYLQHAEQIKMQNQKEILAEVESTKEKEKEVR